MFDPGNWSVADFASAPAFPKKQARRRNRRTGDGRGNRHAFRPGQPGSAWERLEVRRLMDASTDLTSEITTLLSTEGPSGSYTFPKSGGDVTVGKFLKAQDVSISWSGVSQDPTTKLWTGNVTVDATSANLALGAGLTGTITPTNPTVATDYGLSGTYALSKQALGSGAYALKVENLGLTDSGVFTAAASGVTLNYSTTAAAGQTLITVASAQATFAPLNNAMVTLGNLQVQDDGFTIATGLASANSITLDKVLSITSPTVSVTNVSYSDPSGAAAPTVSGTISVSAASAALTLGNSALTASVTDFSGVYDFGTNAVTANATDANLSVNSVITADARNPTLTYNPSSDTLAISSTSAGLTSSLFRGAAVAGDSLNINSTGFSVGDATLVDPNAIKLGGVLDITGLTVGVRGLDYASGTLTGTITVGTGIAATPSTPAVPGKVSLLPGSGFNSTVNGFQGTVVLTNQGLSSLALSDTSATLNVGPVSNPVFTLSTKLDSFTLTANNNGTDTVNVAVGSATASLPREGVTGSLANLTITNQGFNTGSATLSDAGSVSAFNNKFSIANPSVTLTNFGYNTATKSFSNNGKSTSLALSADSVTIQPATSVTLKATGATGITGTLDFGSTNLGHFTFSAGTVSATFGSLLTLIGNNIAFDSSPAAGGDIAKLGSVTATVTLGSTSVTGTATNIAIDANGHLAADPSGKPSISFTSSQATSLTGSSIKLPSWLPIQVQSLGVTWDNNFATDPLDFTLSLSASVDADLGGVALTGDVTNLTVDTGLLSKGDFPITGIDGAGLNVSGNFGGATVSGGAFVKVLDVDAKGNPIADGDTTTPVAGRVFYGGILGSLQIEKVAGFSLRVGLSQDGPLTGYLEDDTPIELDPVSGLTINDLYAGIEFGRTLQTPASAKDLTTNPSYTPVGQLSLTDWESRLRTQVATQVTNPNPSTDPFNAFKNNMVIDAGATLYSSYASANAVKLTGDVQISTDGKILVAGTLTLGDSLKINAGAFLDLSKASQHEASLLFYAQAPASAPILSFYGSLNFAPVMDNSGKPEPDTVQISIGTTTAPAEADLKLPSLPGGLDILGTVVFTADDATNAYDLSVAGTATLEPLGASISLSGDVHFDDDNGPELYGAVLVDNTGTLTDLQNAGIDIKTAVAVIRFNTTGRQQTVTLPTPPGGTAIAPQTLPAKAVDLFIDGDVTLKNQVEIDGLLYARFTTDAVNGPELDVVVTGTGPNVSGKATDPNNSATATILTSPNSGPSSTALTLDASGILVISKAGLAASLGVRLAGGNGLSKAGVTVSGDVTLAFTINTLGQDVTVNIPTYNDPSGNPYPGSGTNFKISGTPTLASNAPETPTPYFLLTGSGDLYLTKGGNASAATGLDLKGSFDFLITPSLFELDMNDTLNVDIKGKPILSFGAVGDLVIGDAGIQGAVQLAAGTSLPGPAGDDFQFGATFVLGVNTTGAAYTPTNLPSLTIQPDTAEIEATGDLKVGPPKAQFDLNGTVDITLASSGGFQFAVDANANLPLLGTIAANGDLTITESGLYGDLSLNTNAATFAGFSLTGEFNLQFNSTSTLQSVNGVALPADQFQLDVEGDLTISKALDLSGELDLTLNGSGFAVGGNVNLQLFNQKVASATFFASIQDDANQVPQLALYAGLGVSAALQGSGISISVGRAFVEVNTGLSNVDTRQSVNGSDLVIPSRTVEVGLQNASINVFGFQTSGSIYATVSNGGLDFQIPQSDPLSLSFLKFGQIEVYGDINSTNNTFSLTAEAGYNVRLGTDTAALDLSGSLHVTISNLGFAAGFAGAADLDLSGIKYTLAAISADIAIEKGYFEIDASLTLFNHRFGFKDQLGQAPTPPAGTAGLTFLSIPVYAAAGSDVDLSANINNSSGNSIGDGNYQWVVTTPSGSTIQDQPAPTGTTPPANPSTDGYYPIVLDAPGTYTVTLYDNSQSSHVQVAQRTITVIDQAPTIPTLGLAAIYPTGQNTAVDVNPTVITPVDGAVHPVSITYTVYKNYSTTPFAHAYDTDNELEIFPDTPASGTTDTYQVTATVNDGYGGVTTSPVSSFKTLDINNIVVNTTADRLDPASSGYRGPDGTITLRDAIAFADSFSSQSNSNYLNPKIRFDPSLAGQTITLTQRDTSGPSNLGTTALNISQAMTIDGGDAPGLTIAVASGSINRVFTVDPAAKYSQFSLTVKNLNISGGTAEDAAFPVDGNGTPAEGGAFYVGANTTLNLFEVALVNNTAIGFGRNTNSGYIPGAGRGGAVYVAPGAGLFGYNLTIANNTAKGSTSSDAGLGAAIEIDGGTANLFQATIVGNSMSGRATGGAIETFGGSLQLVNSIVADTVGGPNLFLDTATNVHDSVKNLYSDSALLATHAYPSGTTYSSSALKLGGLAARGDGIESVSLLPGSPAIGGATGNYLGENDNIDIRGLPRVVGGQNINSVFDVGSYEHQADVVTDLNSSGPGSLSNAVATDDDGSPIVFAPGLTGVINLTGPLVPMSDITITGPGANLLTVSGNDRVELLNNPGHTLTIGGLTLAHGLAANGGAIDNAGTLTLTNVALLNNAALEMAFSPNSNVYQATGGAILNEKGASLILNSDTFANNSIQPNANLVVPPSGQVVATFGSGGAIENNGTLTATNVTFADNSATPPGFFGPSTGVGGAVDNNGTATFTDSTFAFNGLPTLNGQGFGDDIANNTTGKLSLSRSILANPQSNVDLVNAGTLSGSNNLIMSSSGVPASLIVSTADPMLRPLGNYGGSTPTLAMTVGSPAIGQVTPDGSATDQRGYARSTNGLQDLGAFQLHYYTVTNRNDSGPGSLRQAVSDDMDETPIVLPSTLLLPINLTSGPIVFTHDTTITGPGARKLRIDGGGKTELFQVNAGTVVNLSGLTLANGYANQGGAINNLGTLIVNAVQFNGNSAVGASRLGGVAGDGVGGAILNQGGATLTVTNSTFAGNSAVGGANAAQVGYTGEALGGNAFGGAINNFSGGRITLVDDTFFNNQAVAGFSPNASQGGLAFGGAIDNDGNLVIVNSTLDKNGLIPTQTTATSLAHLGGDIWSTSSLTLYNTIAANGGIADDIDASGRVVGDGNLVMTSTGLPRGLVATNADPLLNSPVSKGNAGTQTQTLARTSPALAAGDATQASGLDQIGNARVVSGAVDIGAVESQVPLVSPSAGTPIAVAVGNSFVLNASGTINPDNLPLTYAWDISSPSATSFSFTLATGVSPRVNVSQLQALGLTPGTYDIRVRVSDGYGGGHTVVSTPVTLTLLPGLDVKSVTAPVTGFTRKPVDSATIVTTDPIPLAALGAQGVLTLTLNGQAVQLDPTKLTFNAVAGQTDTYQVSGLAAFETGQGAYNLSIHAGQLVATYGFGLPTIDSVSWTLDTTPPTSKVQPLPAVIITAGFVVTVTGSDPAPTGVTPSGVAKYDLYVSVDGGAYTYWTTVPANNPSATYTPVGSHSYAFQSFATDNAGNHEVKATAAEATTFVPLGPPQANVVAVNTNSSTFVVSYAQTPNGNANLDHINLFVSVDGGPATQFADVSNSKGATTYQALVDGLSHTYGFYAEAVDGLGNTQAAPATPDITETAQFGTVGAANAPLSLTVDHGAAGRSYVRYVDLAFGNADGLANLVAGGHVHLVEHDLNGNGSTPVALTGVLHVVDHAIEFDFGAAGIGGKADSTSGDGYYEIDVDGSSQAFYFDRLFGDVNGDGAVDNTDIALIASALGNANGSSAANIDGTGAVTAINQAAALGAKGDKLAAGLHLDA